MSLRETWGGLMACAYCGFGIVAEGPRECCTAGREYDALRARLTEATRLLRAVVYDTGSDTAARREALAWLAESGK